ncbi:MAG: TerC family protein [Peptococcaceae bacterium]|nr:TerC family protein [Peptococcaceae bacterium]
MNHLAILTSIFMVNVVLSGDNAVVIALASRNLPPRQQKMAVLIGSAGAIVLRIILTVIIVMLFKIPFLQALGGLLLIYIAVKLLREEEAEEEGKTADSLVEAVKIIVFADLIMSLDNTLAIAAVSKGDWLMLIIGLATSIPIIIFCAQIILFLMRKFPVITYIGAGILGWTAGEMLVGDQKVNLFLSRNAGSFLGAVDLAVPAIITALVIVYGWTANLKLRQKAAQSKNNQP